MDVREVVPDFLEVRTVVGEDDDSEKEGGRPGREVIRLAYCCHRRRPNDDDPARDGDLSVLFCGGFRSSMAGIKAEFLERYCADRNLPYCRFDYRGHGQSTRTEEKATTTGAAATTTTAESEAGFWGRHASIGNWISDALRVMDQVLLLESSSRVVVVGSSMGAWIALHLALARPQRVAGLVLLAAAPDFTEDLFYSQLTSGQRAKLAEKGVVHVPSQYDPAQPYPITRHLIEEARRWLVLSEASQDMVLRNVSCPVRLIHGKLDKDISFHKSLELVRVLSTGTAAAGTSSPTASDGATRDVQVTLVEDGDHRLSRPSDLSLLAATLDGLLATIREGSDAEANTRMPGNRTTAPI